MIPQRLRQRDLRRKFAPKSSRPEEAGVDEPRAGVSGTSESPDAQRFTAGKLPGLYPWLRFERITQEQWVQAYGIDLQKVDREAATTYLEGEADFFETAFLDKQRYLQERRTKFADAVSLCGSPIEQVLLARLLWLNYGSGEWVELWNTTKQFAKPDAGVVISPQHQIGKHRVDFAIFLTGCFPNEDVKFVVECDGHEFHEKTKEQAARDKKRDRELQIAGWKVLRFAGGEIMRSIHECGMNVAALARNEINAQRRRAVRGITTG